MIVSEIAFVRPIAILGTYKTEARFSAADGWLIDVHDYGVTLSKPEQQNVPEVPAFCVCGMGYSVPSPTGSSDSKAAEAPAGNPADAGANPAPSTTAGVISEATLGNTELKAEQVLAAGAPAWQRKGKR